MTKYNVSFFLIVVFYNLNLAQSVGVNTNNPDTSAALDIVSTNKGVLVPRLNSFQKTNITNPATGLMVYDIDLSAFCFYNGNSWVVIEKGDVKYVGSSYLGKTSGTGSIGTNEGTIANRNNIYIGNGVGNANTIGNENVGIGEYALSTISTGSGNIGIGKYAGSIIGTGTNNTIIGNNAGVIANSISNATVMGAYANATASNVLILGGTGSYAVKVGIGTSSPNYLLDMQATSDATANIQSSSSNAYYMNVAPNENEAMMKFATYSSGNIYNRWVIGKSNISESGSNVGSDFVINRYNDAGTYLSQPIMIKRATGYINVGGNSSSIANSSLEVDGSLGIKLKSPLVAGITHPNETGTIWRYTSGTGTIILPNANTCANRMYIILNQTGTNITISTYKDLFNAAQTILANTTSLWIVSDGIDWVQIK